MGGGGGERAGGGGLGGGDGGGGGVGSDGGGGGGGCWCYNASAGAGGGRGGGGDGGGVPGSCSVLDHGLAMCVVVLLVFIVLLAWEADPEKNPGRFTSNWFSPLAKVSLSIELGHLLRDFYTNPFKVQGPFLQKEPSNFKTWNPPTCPAHSYSVLQNLRLLCELLLSKLQKAKPRVLQN